MKKFRNWIFGIVTTALGGLLGAWLYDLCAPSHTYYHMERNMRILCLES